MDLEQLLLQKEELPILRETSFIVPIHPVLLRPDIKLNPSLAHQVFPQAAAEWYADLAAYTEGLADGQTKNWYKEVFQREKPIVAKEHRRQTLRGAWQDDIVKTETGFAYGLSISRDGGGSLYFNKEDQCCLRGIFPKLVNFTPEKFKAYAVPNEPFPVDLLGAIAYAYGHHNIDYYPGALFLRNWAILYLNAAMKALGEEMMNR